MPPLLPRIFLLAVLALFGPMAKSSAQTVVIPPDKYPSVSGFVGYRVLNSFSALTRTPDGSTVPGLFTPNQRGAGSVQLVPSLRTNNRGEILGTVTAEILDDTETVLERLTFPVQGQGRFRETTRVDLDETGEPLSDEYSWQARAAMTGTPPLPPDGGRSSFRATLSPSGSRLNGELEARSATSAREEWIGTFILQRGTDLFAQAEVLITVNPDAVGAGGFGITRTTFRATDERWTRFTGDAFFRSPFDFLTGGSSQVRIRPYDAAEPTRPGFITTSHRNTIARATQGAFLYLDHDAFILDFRADKIVDLPGLPRLVTRTQLSVPPSSSRTDIRYNKLFLANPEL